MTLIMSISRHFLERPQPSIAIIKSLKSDSKITWSSKTVFRWCSKGSNWRNKINRSWTHLILKLRMDFETVNRFLRKLANSFNSRMIRTAIFEQFENSWLKSSIFSIHLHKNSRTTSKNNLRNWWMTQLILRLSEN